MLENSPFSWPWKQRNSADCWLPCVGVFAKLSPSEVPHSFSLFSTSFLPSFLVTHPFLVVPFITPSGSLRVLPRRYSIQMLCDISISTKGRRTEEKGKKVEIFYHHYCYAVIRVFIEKMYVPVIKYRYWYLLVNIEK